MQSGAPVERAAGERLRAAGETVAVAESVTGGLVGTLLTDVPGSSDYFDRATVAYSNEAKLEDLGVDRELLEAHGAVSAPVAIAMARGARDGARATWALSTTGIAGPTGGRAGNPVGLVHAGVAYAGAWGTGTGTGTEDSFARSARYLFDGDRRTVRELSARRALADLLGAVTTVDAVTGSGRDR